MGVAKPQSAPEGAQPEVPEPEVPVDSPCRHGCGGCGNFRAERHVKGIGWRCSRCLAHIGSTRRKCAD